MREFEAIVDHVQDAATHQLFDRHGDVLYRKLRRARDQREVEFATDKRRHCNDGPNGLRESLDTREDDFGPQSSAMNFPGRIGLHQQ